VVEDFIQKGKKLSSQGGTSSSSKGGMSNKSAKTNAVVQGIRADQYAQEKLGIRTTVAGPVKGASTSPTGFISTTSSNQMYGSEYQAARNEYLASQGLGTVQKNGSFITGVQTDKGLVFTSQAREAYEASKREPIPLSREMYESQQKTNLAFGALATAASGMTAFFSSAYLSNKATPYSKYVQNFYDTANRSRTTAVPVSSGRNGGNTTTSSNSTSVQDSTAVAQRAKKSYSGALSSETGITTASRDPFLARTDKTIRGAMV
jgi:hypothetical protein